MIIIIAVQAKFGGKVGNWCSLLSQLFTNSEIQVSSRVRKLLHHPISAKLSILSFCTCDNCQFFVL